jgi:hypothetical protein
LTHCNERHLPSVTAAATDALEDGKVLLMPHLNFELMPDGSIAARSEMAGRRR